MHDCLLTLAQTAEKSSRSTLSNVVPRLLMCWFKNGFVSKDDMTKTFLFLLFKCKKWANMPESQECTHKDRSGGILLIIEAIDSKYNGNRRGPRIPSENRYLSEEQRSQS